MQHLPLLDVSARALRAEVCAKCVDRPPDSESLGPDQPRVCEPECSIFNNLPRLLGIAARYDDTMVGRYEEATRELVCQKCQASPTAATSARNARRHIVRSAVTSAM